MKPNPNRKKRGYLSLMSFLPLVYLLLFKKHYSFGFEIIHPSLPESAP